MKMRAGLPPPLPFYSALSIQKISQLKGGNGTFTLKNNPVHGVPPWFLKKVIGMDCICGAKSGPGLFMRNIYRMEGL